MSKNTKVHFLTAYIEYLLDEGIKSEYYYVGDASRFLRFLLAEATEEDFQRFLAASAKQDAYEKRLRKTLKKFYKFASEKLDIEADLASHL